MSFLRATYLIFTRSMRESLRTPIWVVLSLIQPILYLTLFAPLLTRVVANTPGLPPGDEWQIFVPGLLVQLGIFGAAFVGFGLLFEMHAGVIERQRVSPAPRTALLVGRMMRDVVVMLVQAVVLIVVAIPFGLRAPLSGVVVTVLVVGALGAAFSSLSYAAALKLKSEDALAPLFNGLMIPLLLLSGILLPMTLAPHWLRVVSDVNPLKHVVDGARAMFAGDIWTATAGWGLVATVGMVAVGVWLGTLTFRRESA
jgi:ABC-2 type transport system permease protein